MSFRVIVKAPDSRFEHELAEAVRREKAYSHHNGHSRAALDASHELAAGAIKNVPLGSEISADLWGHFDEQGLGKLTVKVEISRPAPVEPTAAAAASAVA